MSKTKINWTGKQVNYFTVIEEAPNYAKEHNLKNQHIYWKCQCICGKICYLNSGTLHTGERKSCGCMRKNKNDLTGKTFGRITVIDENKEETFKHSFKQSSNNARYIYWNCKCNFCGSITVRSSNSLLSNNTKEIRCIRCATVKDITGERNGQLVAKKYIGVNERHEALWLCECDCRRTITLSNALFRKVYSCGCLRKSIGELHIQQILDNNHIKYLFDKAQIFPDLISAKGSKMCRYDFIIINDNDEPIRLIEFDGIQHTNPSTGWYNQDTVNNDKIKNEYALAHNIPLVRIPFTLRDNMTLEDLMGDKFLVK